MRKFVVLCLSICVAMMCSCRQKKHDVAYYEAKVDSIRKAEQVKLIRAQAGLKDEDPLDAFFHQLSLRSLPVQSEGAEWEKLGEFTKVPREMNEYFEYLSDADISVMAMPKAGHYSVVMLVEMEDSVTPALYLYTMDQEHRPVDHLCIYEERSEDRATDFGKTKLEYFITSNYEISLLKYYQSFDATKPEMENARRYKINKEGEFEEIIIEL